MDRNKKMFELRKKGLSYLAIARVFGVSQQRVHQIISGQNHRGIKYWDNIRKLVKQRDGNNCQLCGRGKGVDLIVHHIDENPQNDDFGNLICLCRGCHSHLHRQSGAVDKTKYPRIYSRKIKGL
jgi:5-methylcytosine-specific restriction endonuclease McrA